MKFKDIVRLNKIFKNIDTNTLGIITSERKIDNKWSVVFFDKEGTKLKGHQPIEIKEEDLEIAYDPTDCDGNELKECDWVTLINYKEKYKKAGLPENARLFITYDKPSLSCEWLVLFPQGEDKEYKDIILSVNSKDLKLEKK